MQKGILSQLTVTTNHCKEMLLKINWNKMKHLSAFASLPIEIRSMDLRDTIYPMFDIDATPFLKTF